MHIHAHTQNPPHTHAYTHRDRGTSTGSDPPPSWSLPLPRQCLTWIHRRKLVLDDSDRAKARYHSNANQLQADVQPLHGGIAEEQAALVPLQPPGALLLKPATTGQ